MHIHQKHAVSACLLALLLFVRVCCYLSGVARCVCFHVQVSISDVVFSGDEAGKVCNCLREAGRLFVLVKVLAVVSRLSQHAASYNLTDTLAVWRMELVEQGLAWRSGADGLITVIRN